ncbi:MAG: hypothetical protein DRH56_09340 [Deltaproteobacteria bacterium]|nr:MAG: hypothetical protein DRH56_09340 [Deltaproteobacteria bacterium]
MGGNFSREVPEFSLTRRKGRGRGMLPKRAVSGAMDGEANVSGGNIPLLRPEKDPLSEMGGKGRLSPAKTGPEPEGHVG